MSDQLPHDLFARQRVLISQVRDRFNLPRAFDNLNQVESVKDLHVWTPDTADVLQVRVPNYDVALDVTVRVRSADDLARLLVFMRQL